ncbi:MAG: multicopper oxidase domain-containing protein [Bacteroidia bacterium]|nr:multicopper oxidase domain-containing protein [Bacteroidia bacterium]
MKAKLILLTLIFVLGGLIPTRAQNIVTHKLTAWTTGTHTLWDGNQVEYWGFGKGFLKPPSFPGPTLYANEGDSIIIMLRNQSQGAPHTMHWHGMDVNQANDGVPQTSFVFTHMMDSTYNFRAPHAGTYLYHCHVATVVHVQMGMYGNFVVRPADGSQRAWTNGPPFHQEKVWLMSEFDKSWHDNPPKHNQLDSLYENFHIPKYEPDYFMVNGLSHQQLPDSGTSIYAQAYMNIYVRLSNIGFLLNRIHFPPALNAQVISSDGRPLPNALIQDTLMIAPGERYGVMLHPTTEFLDSVQVSYLDMNTLVPRDTEWVRVDIKGFVGLNSPIEPEVILFPNPGNGSFSLSWQGLPPGQGQVECFDLHGRKMQTFTRNFAHAGTDYFEISDLTPGIYLIKIRVAGKEICKKMLVEGR